MPALRTLREHPEIKTITDRIEQLSAQRLTVDAQLVDAVAQVSAPLAPTETDAATVIAARRQRVTDLRERLDVLTQSVGLEQQRLQDYSRRVGTEIVQSRAGEIRESTERLDTALQNLVAAVEKNEQLLTSISAVAEVEVNGYRPDGQFLQRLRRHAYELHNNFLPALKTWAVTKAKR